MVGDLPVLRAVHVLYNMDGDGLRLLVRELDLEALVDDVGAIVDVEVSLAPRAGEVEGVAADDLHGLLGRGVLNNVFANELHLAAAIVPIEAKTARGQRHSEMVALGVFDLLQDCDMCVRRTAEELLVVVVAGIEALNDGAGAFVLICALDGDVRRFEELNLLGLAIV